MIERWGGLVKNKVLIVGCDYPQLKRSSDNQQNPTCYQYGKDMQLLVFFSNINFRFGPFSGLSACSDHSKFPTTIDVVILSVEQAMQEDTWLIDFDKEKGT